jgi:hypothetical protein
MSRQLAELETILIQLIAEHDKLLHALESHQAAMKTLNMKGMDETARLQETSRLKIMTLETRRKMMANQLAATLRLAGPPTLLKLAEAMPHDGNRLLELRDQLKEKIAQVSSRAHVAGRLAGAVLGHLNTAVRLVAGAVEQAGLYTKQGVPQVSARIGVLEAVG